MRHARRMDDARSRLGPVRDLVVIGLVVAGVFVLGSALDIYDRAEDYLLGSGNLEEVLALGLLTLIGLSVFSIRRMAQVSRERSLRFDTEHQFRTVIEQVPATTYTSDATKPAGEASILYMSPQVEKLLGFPAADWLTDPGLWLRCIHPEDRHRVIAESNGADATGETFRVEYRGVHRDGRVVWIQDESNIVSWDKEGRPLVAQGVMWDITPRKDAEVALRDAEERFRQLTEHLPVVAYTEAVTDAPEWHAISYVAPGILELTGYTPEEWTSSKDFWQRLIHPDDREGVLAVVADTDRTQAPFAAEYRITRRDGRVIWIADSAVLVEQGKGLVWQGVMQDITQRRSAEEAVRIAEERYRSLVEQLPVAIYTDAVDELSTAIYISPQYENLTGYTPQQRLTQPELWVQMLHPDDRERVLAESERTNSTGEPFELEYRIVHADGRVVWLHDYATLVTRPDGEQIWQGVLSDVTDRREAEDALARRDRILEAATFAGERFLNVPDWTDAIGEVLHKLGTAVGVSRAYVYRNEEDDVDGLTMNLADEWVAPGVTASNELESNLRLPYDRGYGRWSVVLSSGGAIHGPTREHPPEERYEAELEGTLSLCAVPVFVGELWWGFIGFDQCDEEREWLHAEIEWLRVVANTLGAAINRQASASKLAEAEQRFRAIVEHVPAAIYLDAPDRSLQSIYVSPQIEEITGITREEWLSDPSSWINAIHPEDRDRIVGTYVTAVERQQAWASEYRMVTVDGRTIWVRDETTLLHDTDGAPLFLQGVISDITDRKLAEEALRGSERREREAAERLRSLDEMKNTFLAAVSHELRSPLTSILGLSLTLERAVDMPVDDRADLLARLGANARKLDRLLKDLLDIDRLSRGIVEPQYRSTDVGELAMRTAESLEALAGHEIHVAAQPVHVEVDPPKVERIIENLLTNAVRHTRAEGTIWLGVEPHGDGVIISVEDDGPGVPAELRTAIFEPFRQGSTGAPHAPGTGIGLSLVASFAELHGGRAWVEERKGGGASFRVSLPGRDAASNGETTQVPSLSSRAS